MRTSVSSIIPIVFMATASCVGGAASVWFRDGRSVVLREPGKIGSSRVALGFQPHDLAVSAAGAILYVSDTCLGRAAIRFREPLGREKRIAGLNRLFGQWASMLEARKGRIDSLALSPSGETGAFVLRPCTPYGAGEVSEHVGVVYVLSTRNMQVRVLKGSLDDRGLAAGMAMDLKFSPDERELLVNYEGSFAVFDVASGEQVFGSDVPFVPSAGWTNATGWLSNACIAFRTAPDGLAPDVRAPMAVNTRSRAHRTLGEVAGVPDERLKGVEAVNSDYGLRRRAGKWEVVSLRTGDIVLQNAAKPALPSFGASAGFSAVAEGRRYEFCAVSP